MIPFDEPIYGVPKEPQAEPQPQTPYQVQPMGFAGAGALPAAVGKEFLLTLPRPLRLKSLLAYTKSQYDSQKDDAANVVIQQDLAAERQKMLQARSQMGAYAEQLGQAPPEYRAAAPTLGEGIAGLLGGLGGGFAQATNQQAGIMDARNQREYANQMAAYKAKRDALGAQMDLAENDLRYSQGRVSDLEQNARQDARYEQQRADARKAANEEQIARFKELLAKADKPELVDYFVTEIQRLTGENVQIDTAGIKAGIERDQREKTLNRDMDNFRADIMASVPYGGASDEVASELELRREELKRKYGVTPPPVPRDRTVAERKMENAPIEAQRKKLASLQAKYQAALAQAAEASRQGNRTAFDSAMRTAVGIKAEMDALGEPGEGEVRPVQVNAQGQLTGPIGGGYGYSQRPPEKPRKGGSGGGGGSKQGGGGYSGLSGKQVAQKQNYYRAAQSKVDAADAEMKRIAAKGAFITDDDVKQFNAAKTRKNQGLARLRELNAEMNARKPKKPAPKKPSGGSKPTPAGNKWRIVG